MSQDNTPFKDREVDEVRRSLNRHLQGIVSGDIQPDSMNILDTLAVTILNAESMYVHLFIVLNGLEQGLKSSGFKSNSSSSDFTTVKDQYGKQD